MDNRSQMTVWALTLWLETRCTGTKTTGCSCETCRLVMSINYQANLRQAEADGQVA
jgi:hypothetical protein